MEAASDVFHNGTRPQLFFKGRRASDCHGMAQTMGNVRLNLSDCPLYAFNNSRVNQFGKALHLYRNLGDNIAPTGSDWGQKVSVSQILVISRLPTHVLATR